MKEKVVAHLFDSFVQRKGEEMAQCYSKTATFEDPAFGQLIGDNIGNMWKMLLSNSTELSVEYRIISTDTQPIIVKWEAHYPFSKTGRKVHNKVTSRLWVEEGEIVKQIDHFNLWTWSKQALGPTGWLLGWTSFFQKKLNAQTAKMLQKHISNI